MTSVSINHEEAAKSLAKAWKEASNRKSMLDLKVKELIKSVFDGPSIGFRYLVVTGILARYTNSDANARALQKGSDLTGAYDARSLCHKVIVPFEHERGDMWGFSNEPFLSKALRHKEHDKNNPQLRDKLGAGKTQGILDWANEAEKEDLFEALVFIVEIGIHKLRNTPKVEIGAGRNLEVVRNFTQQFLSGPADGGSRLIAIVGAFVKEFNTEATVNIYNPNASDQFSKTAGDIEIILNKKLISAYECKDKPFNDNDVEDGIRKAETAMVREYVFVSGFHSKKIDFDFSTASAEAGIDFYSIHIPELLDDWTAALNVNKRAEFGKITVEILIAVKKSETAKVAQQLWEKCLKEFS